MKSALLLSCSPGELWAALLRDGSLARLRVRRAERPGLLGEILLGRIVALKPELPAALVDIGLDRPGFLSAEDAAPGRGIAGLTEGQALIVQVSKEARGDKATGLSLRPRLAGRLAELTPTRHGITAEKGLESGEARRLTEALGAEAAEREGIVLRKRAAGEAAEALRAEIATLRRRWQGITAAASGATPPQALEAPISPVGRALAEFVAEPPDEIVIDDRASFGEARAWLAQHQPALVERLALYGGAMPLFEDRDIAADIAAALSPRVALAAGGGLTIEQTAAATVIDVDIGAAGGGSGKAARAIAAANRQAAQEIARQIRLRGLAGPIVIDFIGTRDRAERERLRQTLAEALAGEAEVLGWTRLGHLEIVRKRRETPLTELLYERAPGGGQAKTALTLALEALRGLDRAARATPPRAPTLRLHPEVAAALDGAARSARHELERRLGRAIAVHAEPGRARDSIDMRLD